MEHIVQFAIGIDDKGIKERIERSAEKQIIERLYHDIALTLTNSTRWTEYPISSELQGAFKRIVKEAVDNAVNQHKDEIIKEAATILADRLFRTKAAKEHPEEAADATKPKQEEPCGVKPEDFVNHFITEMLMRHEGQIEKLIQNVEKLMQPVNEAEEPKPEPKRTYKDVLLAAFPDACVSPDGIPDACPLSLDKHYDCNKFPNCLRCKRAHWNAEAEK